MPDMNCTEFETQLRQLVLDRRSLDEGPDEGSGSRAEFWRDLRAQANACPHCRQLWNEFALLDRALPLCRDLTPPVDLADAVISRWKNENATDDFSTKTRPPISGSTQSPRSTGRSAIVLLMAIAAAVLACFAVLITPRQHDELPPTFPVAKNDSPDSPGSPINQRATKPVKTPDLNWQTMAEEAGSAYWALANDTAESLASVTVFVPARKPAPKKQSTEAVPPQESWTKGIGTGLKPIGRDVGRAMGFLLDALPDQKTL